MHNRFDQFVKRLAREGYSPGGQVETDAEVSQRKPRPHLPTQWIISSGRPSSALAGLCFHRSRWGRGIYEGPALLRTKLVVVSELPRTRDTLLVRLMGAGKVLERAIADVRALPPDAPERCLALPILVRLRLEIPADPAKQTKIDREFLMTTQEINKFLDELRQEGRDEGFAQAVLAAYKARFGAPPAALVVAVEQEKDHVALQRWLEMVTTRSVDDVAAALRRPRKTQPARPSTNRRSAAPRRASASK